MIDWTRENLARLKEGLAAGRWSPLRKADLIRALDARELTEAEAMEEFALTSEELHSWRKLARKGGIPALRTTRIQSYR